MEIIDALEKYLITTRQIDMLALRQARLVCRVIADEQLRAEATPVVLLALAALRKGSPRADREAIVAPLSDETIAFHAASYLAVNNSPAPWAPALDGALAPVSLSIDRLLNDPGLFAPVSGAAPVSDGSWPILVAGCGLIGFSRYWHAAAMLENQLIPGLLRKTAALPDTAIVRQALARVFTMPSMLGSGQRFHYRQVAAAALACRTRFLILSGGPGTGKTRVVLQILRTLLQVFPEISADRIALCAPTGRAKARMGESLFDGLDELYRRSAETVDPAAVREQSLRNLHCKTIHSLLGMRPDGSAKYNRVQKLPHQVIIVDEASMMDLDLFQSLLEAMTETCLLILAGDMHQLPSVDAGAVLGDLTGCFTAGGNTATLSGACAAWVADVTSGIDADGSEERPYLEFSTPKALAAAGPLADHAILLTRSYRSEQDILTLAREINTGEAEAAVNCAGTAAGSATVSIDITTGTGPVETWLRRHFDSEKITNACILLGAAEIEQISPEHIVAARDLLFTSAVLTLAHDGPRGRRAINRLAGKLLRERLGNPPDVPFFRGLPVILGANHYDLDLYNGDLGVVLHLRGQGTKVLFPRGKGYRLAALDRLADLEAAFALTVHKSQGSEFDNVLLVLPEQEKPLLSRQIIYTGITRARKRVRILGSSAILTTAIKRQEKREGGLRIG